MKSLISRMTSIEREIGELAKEAKLRLRFDKVARRLTGELQGALAGVLPAGQSVVITVTAPIKHPAKTAESLVTMMRNGSVRGELRKEICGNTVRVRPINRVATHMPKVLAFAHNPETDAGRILDIAEARLFRRE